MAGWDSFGSVVKFVDSDSEKSESEKSQTLTSLCQSPVAVADPLWVKESSGSEADAGSDHEPSAPPAFAVSQQGEDSGETTDVFDWQGDESEMPGPAAPASGSLEQRLGDVLGDDIAGDHSGSAAPGSGRQLKRNESTASSSHMQKRWRSLAETEFGKSLHWSQLLQEKMRVDQQWADQLLKALTHQLDQRKARGGFSRAMVFESFCTATGAYIYNWQAGHKLLSLTRCDVMFRVFLFVICCSCFSLFVTIFVLSCSFFVIHLVLTLLLLLLLLLLLNLLLLLCFLPLLVFSYASCSSSASPLSIFL